MRDRVERGSGGSCAAGVAVIAPTIHLNGSGRQRLLDQCMDATQALVGAIDAVNAMSPNGRDYYPQGSGAIAVATGEHLARLRKLEEIRAEIAALAEAIADAP